MKKNILLFDPDWYYFDQIQLKTHLVKMGKPSVVIYYDFDIKGIIQETWGNNVKCIHYYDILKNMEY